MTRLQSETTIRIKFSVKIKLSEGNLLCVYVFLLVFIFSLSSFISSILYLSTHVSLSDSDMRLCLSNHVCVSLSISLCVLFISVSVSHSSLWQRWHKNGCSTICSLTADFFMITFLFAKAFYLFKNTNIIWYKPTNSKARRKQKLLEDR